MATIDRRETKAGENRFRVRIRRRGVVETASFASFSEAREWAREVEEAIDAGRWSHQRSGGDFTLGWVLDRYLADRRPGRDARRQLEWWRGQLGSVAAGEISRRQLLQLRRHLLAEVTRSGRRRRPATVNRYVAALSGLFTWAVRRDYLSQHPLLGLEPLAEERPRLRVLSDDERNALIEACRATGGRRLETLVVLALSTGARRGELLALRWSDVDLMDGRIDFRGQGRSSGRSLPLPNPGMALLRDLARVRRIDGNLVFSDANGKVRFPRAAWETAVLQTGLVEFRFRDLRHSAAAYLARSGASLPEIAAVLGARSLQSVRRYSRLTEAQTPVAIRRMQEDLFQT